MNLPEIKKAMAVMDHAQDALWELHHRIKEVDEELGTAVWLETLQIEHALKVLNKELFGKDEYFEEKT